MIQIIYNSKKSYDDFRIIAKSVNRPLLPAKRNSEVVVPGHNGSYDFSDDSPYENIIIPVVIQYISDTFSDLRSRARNIAAWLGQTSYKPLIFTDEPDKYYLAKIYDAISVEKIVNLNPGETATVNFECCPLAFGELVVIDFVNDEAVITNVGTYQTSLIIEAVFTADVSEFKVIKGVEFIKVVHDFKTNDTLKINTGTGSILINGVVAMDKLDWQNSRYFNLSVGENTLNITPTGKCSATIKYTTRWL